MKKFSAIVALLFASLVGFSQEDAGRTKFDYYPDANVYFNTATKTYLYLDSAQQKWVSVEKLPAAKAVSESAPKKTLYYDGPDIWKNNYNHVKIFGTKAKAKS